MPHSGKGLCVIGRRRECVISIIVIFSGNIGIIGRCFGSIIGVQPSWRDTLA
jgi:hypothetical protein